MKILYVKFISLLFKSLSNIMFQNNRNIYQLWLKMIVYYSIITVRKHETSLHKILSVFSFFMKF